MADRFKGTTTTITPTDAVLISSAMTTFSQSVPIEQGICGTIHMQAKLTAGSASQKIDIYAAYSEDGQVFDDFDVANCPIIATINLKNETNVYRNYTARLDGMAMAGKFMKIAALPSSAGTGTIAGGSLKMYVKKPL